MTIFDEETEQAIDEYVEEMSEAQREHDLLFWEGCTIVTAPAGAPPEYITVEVDGVNDPNVEWRGVPSTPAVGDEVLVWENPASHRREIVGASGAGGVTGGGSWCQKVVVAECGGDFTTLSAAITWINALPAGQVPAATRLYAINMLGGNFAEAGDVTIPQYVHVSGEGEGTELEMGANTLVMSDDTSLSDIVVESTDPSEAIRVNGKSNVVLRNVRCIQGYAADCFHVYGASTGIEMYHCIAGASTVNAVGFHVGDTADVYMEDCVANDSTNFADALLLDASLCAAVTYRCTFVGNGDDVQTGANSVWYHHDCRFYLTNCTLAAATHYAEPGKRFNQTLTVAEYGGEFQALSEAVTYINAQGDAAAGKLYGVLMLGGNFAEVGDVTIPQYVHVFGMGEGTEIEMGANTLIMSSNSSLQNVVVESSDTSYGVRLNGATDVVLDNVKVIMSAAGDNIEFAGASSAELRHVVLERSSSGVGFDVLSTSSIQLFDCEADDTTNISVALQLAASACSAETRRCVLRAATDDVSTGAGSTWNSYKDRLSPLNCSLVGTVAMQDLNAGDSFAFVVENTSGGAAAPADLGYIDENGEYKTTATAYSDVAWCVVVVGGANNNDIWVARRGRVTVTLNGNCAAGDYLYTSTTAGQAQPQSYIRPEVFAVALTANAAGAGGTCSALLLCHRKKSPLTDANYTVDIRAASDSTWASTINGAPVGAVVTYNVPIAGNEDSIVPNAAGMLAKPVLHNTTRGDYALIQSVNTGANTITLTAAAPGGWANNDNIQVNSLTCVLGAAPFWFDMEFEDTTVVPQLAVGFGAIINWSDTAAANQTFNHHSFEAYAASKMGGITGQVANQMMRSERFIPIFQRRFCYRWDSSGAGTGQHWSQLVYIVVAAP